MSYLIPFSCPPLDGYLNKTHHPLITDQYPYNGHKIYYYRCLVDYIYQFLINTFPKGLQIEQRIIYCQSLANDIIDVLHDPSHSPYDDVFSFYIFSKLELFDNDYWGNSDRDTQIRDNIMQNYNNVKILVILTEL